MSKEAKGFTKGHEGNTIKIINPYTKEDLNHQWGLVWDEVVAYPVSEGLQDALDFIDSVIDHRAYEIDRKAKVKEYEQKNHKRLVKEYTDYLQEQTKGWDESYLTMIEGYWEWVDTELLKEEIPF